MDHSYLRVVREESDVPRPEEAERREFLLHVDDDVCVGCLGCVRICPSKAIRVTRGRPQIVEQKCVRCGLCVSECGRGAMKVRDDTDVVRELLAGERPVVALLASEFVAAMHPASPAEVEQALESLGFYSVESTLLGEEIVAERYERTLARDNGLFVIRSTCPVVVDWIRRFYPHFAQALAPLVPPYVAQARLVRELYAEEVAVVYVSPCFARKDEAFDPQFEGAIDACIDFMELRRLVEEDRGADRKSSRQPPSGPRPCKELSLTDGFPRLSLASRSMLDSGVEVTRGLRECERLLRAITDGESGPEIVDMLNCEGCIDGPAVNPGMSVFAKRNIETAEREANGCASVSTRAMLRYLPNIEVIRSFPTDPVLVPVPDDERIDELLAEAGISRDKATDCGACGYSTCVEHAAAVHAGDSTWEMCFPLQRRLLAESMAQLAASTALDPATGVWSRRIVLERLSEEFARAVRYRSPFAVLALGIDELAEIRDEYGIGTAEDVVTTVATILREVLRTTDICGRYADDIFLVLLPETEKTAGFAVAEKLRERLAHIAVPVRGPGYREPAGKEVPVQVSMGVAGRANGGRAEGLVEAAMAALDDARRAGGGQVSIAPG